MKQWRRLMSVIGVSVVAVLAMPAVWAQVAPGAPSGLTYVVNGQSVTLRWTHSTGAFTHYRLEAGGAPGQTFYIFDSSALVDPLHLPNMLAAFSAGGIGPGDYYVRIRGVNGTVFSGPSNEVVVPIRTTCVTPGAPTNYGALVRGTLGLLQWNTGSGGQPTTYTLLADYVPNSANPPIRIPIGNTTGVLFDIPPGVYYTSIVASNACGVSGRSNEITVTSPGSTPVTTPNPPAGERVARPEIQALVASLAQQAAALGYLVPDVACPLRPGYASTDIEARKTQLNAYINFMVTSLRTIDHRFGFNAKPTRANAIIAGDEIAYHYGSDAPEGSPNVYLWDVLGGHCTGVLPGDTARPVPVYRPFTDEFGRWTAAGQFVP